MSSELTNKFNIKKSINYVFAVFYTILWVILTWYFGVGSLAVTLGAFSSYNFFFQIIALGIGLITPIFCIATIIYIWKFYKLQDYLAMHCCNFIPFGIGLIVFTVSAFVIGISQFLGHKF